MDIFAGKAFVRIQFKAKDNGVLDKVKAFVPGYGWRDLFFSPRDPAHPEDDIGIERDADFLYEVGLFDFNNWVNGLDITLELSDKAGNGITAKTHADSILAGIVKAIINSIKAFVEAVGDAVSKALEWILEVVAQIVKSILQPLVDSLAITFGSLLRQFGKAFGSYDEEEARRAVGTAILVITGLIIATFVVGIAVAAFLNSVPALGVALLVIFGLTIAAIVIAVLPPTSVVAAGAAIVAGIGGAVDAANALGAAAALAIGSGFDLIRVFLEGVDTFAGPAGVFLDVIAVTLGTIAFGALLDLGALDKVIPHVAFGKALVESWLALFLSFAFSQIKTKEPLAIPLGLFAIAFSLKALKDMIPALRALPQAFISSFGFGATLSIVLILLVVATVISLLGDLGHASALAR